MNQNDQPNRCARSLLEKGYVMPQGVPTSWNPMDRARGLRHKKPYQHKQAAKYIADHGVSR